MKTSIIAILCLGIIFGGYFSLRLIGGPVADVAALSMQDDKLQPLQGELEIFPLTNDYLVVAGLYDDFFNRQIKNSYSQRLNLADDLRSKGKLPYWSYRFFYNFATADVLGHYLGEISKNFQNPNYFEVYVNGQKVPIDKNGYWINAVGCKRTPHPSEKGTELTNSAELVPFAYLKLAEPLKNNDQVSIRTAIGERKDFTYNDDNSISRIIKVNQVGYVPDAKQKYAYLGMWMGSLGALDLSEFEGKDFYLKRAADHGVAYQGKIRLRAKEQFIERKGIKMLLDGEMVMEMDFSDFSENGKYYIQVPQIGRSWEFVIGPDAMGEAFYVQMRGLFHERSGIAKSAKYTQWSMGADHQESYRGGFLPNDRHYTAKEGLIKNAEGKSVEIRHFEMVKATATNEVLKNVFGGWWDAGDFDRRTYHFEVVDSLLSVFLLFPQNFSDNQLDIPESGNGIADIVDEAAWGVDVWRRAQNEQGGVGCWLEAFSHPENPDPVADTQKYYLAAPTRESTILYCAYAAKLARAYKQSNALEKSKLFFDSAEKAWNYAMDTKNNAKIKFFLPKLGELFYEEPLTLPPENVFKAALNLYMYNNDEKYALALDKMDFDKVLTKAKDAKSAYFLSELVERQLPYMSQVGKYKQMVRKKADYFLQSQQNLAYRNINWEKDSAFFLFLGWGAGLPFAKGSYLIMAWNITGDEKYRTGALLGFDWMMGTNPMGRTMTTGLGKVYPVRILSLPMWAWRDRLVDPIPGITPYTFTGRNNYAATKMIFCFNFEPREDHKFKGMNINLLPNSLSDKKVLSSSECYDIIQRFIPVWRRFANVEGYAVDQNEFSVWETMAPAAAAYGALLSPQWQPPADWKNKKPKSNLTELDGYIFLP